MANQAVREKAMPRRCFLLCRMPTSDEEIMLDVRRITRITGVGANSIIHTDEPDMVGKTLTIRAPAKRIRKALIKNGITMIRTFPRPKEEQDQEGQ